MDSARSWLWVDFLSCSSFSTTESDQWFQGQWGPCPLLPGKVGLLVSHSQGHVSVGPWECGVDGDCCLPIVQDSLPLGVHRASFPQRYIAKPPFWFPQLFSQAWPSKDTQGEANRQSPFGHFWWLRSPVIPSCSRRRLMVLSLLLAVDKSWLRPVAAKAGI